MTEEVEMDYEIGREKVPDIAEGKPQEVHIEAIIKQEGGKYGPQRTRVLCEFRRSKDGGFLWQNATPVRPTLEDVEPNLSFNPFHIYGVERAVEYVEKHYGPVNSRYPSMQL